MGDQMASDVRAPETAGVAIAGYEDFTRIAIGGFSIVYTARQARFDRTVAVKVLNADLRDAAATARFTRECQASGRLSDVPEIVTVLDAGATDDGRPFIAMQYFPRGSLADRLRAGPLSVGETVAAGAAIARALRGAHALAVLHRDLKPGNILVTDGGSAVLTDFGVASIAALDHATSQSAFTPQFTAPEILDRVRYTSAADVYALGVTLHTLLAGVPPFAPGPDEGPATVFRRIIAGDAPPLGEDVPEPLRALIARMMAVDPAGRPAAADVATHLTDLREQLGVEPIAAPPEPAAGPTNADVSTDAPAAGQLAAGQLAAGQAKTRLRPPRAGGGAARRGGRRRAAGAVTVAVVVLAGLGLGVWYGFTRPTHHAVTITGATSRPSHPAGGPGGTPRPALTHPSPSRTAAAPTGGTATGGPVAGGTVAGGSNAPPTGRAGILAAGQVLAADQRLISPDDKYILLMQGDGNLIVFNPLGMGVWSSESYPHPGSYLQMQRDGNLVVYGSGHTAIFSSNTGGHPGSDAEIGNDGSLAVYSPAHTVLWSSGPVRSALHAGETLSQHQTLVSPDGSHLVVMQANGDLVLFGPDHVARWSSNTAGHPGADLEMAADGNLILYGPDRAVLWTSNTAGHPGADLEMRDDGNLVVYGPDRAVLWASNTAD
jgi:Protein kinase domain